MGLNGGAELGTGDEMVQQARGMKPEGDEPLLGQGGLDAGGFDDQNTVQQAGQQAGAAGQQVRTVLAARSSRSPAAGGGQLPCAFCWTAGAWGWRRGVGKRPCGGGHGGQGPGGLLAHAPPHPTSTS